MSSYRSYVAKQSRRYPSSLQPLCYFLDDPLVDQNVCRMGVLEFTPDTPAPAYRDLDHQGLYSILSDDTTTKSSFPYGRIVIIEDLSREIVEMLGSLLHIDPLFFASHIGHNGPSGDSTIASALRSRKQPFITNHYYRAVTLHGLQEGCSSQYSRETNVNREVMLLPPTQDGTCNALIQHNCSIFVQQNRNDGWLGLILVDPSIHNNHLILRQTSNSKHLPYTPTCHLFQGGYEDFLDSNSPANEWDSYYPPRHGLFEDQIYYWQTECPTSFKLANPPTISLAYYPIQIILSEWTNTLTALDQHIQHHETTISSLPNQPLHPDQSNPNPNLHALMTLHRRLQTFTTHISQTHHFLQHQEKTLFDLLHSYETIATALAQLSSTLSNTLIPTAASLTQLVEIKRTESQTFRVNQLTYLAFGFVPLSFVTSLYGMSDEFAPGGKNFWQWFVVAIPLSVFCLWCMESSTRPDGWLRRMQGRRLRIELLGGVGGG
ncbi:hypothetical protein BO94DRAFT_626205 [Aspergillus sclerotioniger CBS 115572]|uniref:Cora-domain-containing protein n=1 Tax=Aspergillus sclerotioniger CBS 115572 TaxID=1450535 RepID=A0A317W1R0_9EURO|nr:hypothetical protein BO94DRAFT_626205 [Aspergillus sclerotioniger CBS 115572]PWY80413.1 hypothetical protein BO94DRAFT_626205 [Aspergillus sclerotioniger CBS 115572]